MHTAISNMAAPNPEEMIIMMRFSVIVLAGVAVGVVFYHQWLEMNKLIKQNAAPPFVDFEKLRRHLESKTDKKDTVNIQGTIVQEETKCVRSGKGEVEGAARRVVSNGFWQKGDLCTNMSVSFFLRDSETPGNTIRVLEVHGAIGIDSVMQLVSNECGYRETILTFGTRVWIRGCARIEGNTILINPVQICEEIL